MAQLARGLSAIAEHYKREINDQLNLQLLAHL